VIKNLELELFALSFVCSLGTGTLTKLIPWFFDLNHTHYARWMSVHVKEMYSLDSMLMLLKIFGTASSSRHVPEKPPHSC